MREILKQLIAGETLSEEQMFSTIESFMGGDENISDAQIAAFLTALASRLPTAQELVGAARALRQNMVRVSVEEFKLLDTCGTGGSGLNTFNTSTTAAFVVAGAGQPVAKHGTYGVTSKSGSADALQAMGINTDCSKEQAEECIRKANFGFLFAPAHHPATKRVGGIRKQLGFRTIFNLIGPLSNPASAAYQLLGVSDLRLQQPIAEALCALGVERAMVVHGADGLDELTLTTSSSVIELKDGELKNYEISPEQFGLTPVSFEKISGFEPKEAACKIEGVLSGELGARRELVLLNAGAALYVCGRARSVADGIALAAASIDEGAAMQTLNDVRKLVGN